MSKITVTEKILIDGLDLSEAFEPAVASDERSNICFDSTNSDLEITKSGYNKRYATVYDSIKRTKLQDIDASNYQASHSHYLGKLNKQHVWLVEKGCRPLYNALTEIISTTSEDSKGNTVESVYKIKYKGAGQTSVSPSIKLAGSDKPVSTLNVCCFFIAITGAGCSGTRGYTNDQWLIWNINKHGHGGDSPGAAFVFIDLSKLGGIAITLGVGGKGTKDKNAANPGTPTYIHQLNADGSLGTCLLKLLSGQDTRDTEEDNKVVYAEGMPSVITTYIEKEGFKVLSAYGDSRYRGYSSKVSVSADAYFTESGSIKIENERGSNASGNGGSGGGGSIFAKGGSGGEEYKGSSGSSGSDGVYGSSGGGGGSPGPDGGITSGKYYSAGGNGGTAAFKLYY